MYSFNIEKIKLIIEISEHIMLYRKIITLYYIINAINMLTGK